MKTCSKCNLELHLEQFSKKRDSKDGYRSQCKACVKKYNQENKERIRARDKKYYQEKKKVIKERAKIRYQENKDVICDYQKKYREEHEDKVREYNKNYYQENKENICEWGKKYRKENKEEIRGKTNKYQRNRRKTDEGYRILGSLRSRLRSALKGTAKSATTMDLVGCSIEFLVDYLEKTKVEGKDYSDAHIDHIRPCASFDLTDPEQQRECFRYTNLQWLPAMENISKGAKLV